MEHPPRCKIHNNWTTRLACVAAGAMCDAEGGVRGRNTTMIGENPMTDVDAILTADQKDPHKSVKLLEAPQSKYSF